ncbi:serine/threonine-protein kinase DCLK3-like isoform X2 [Styela clava]
MTSPECDSTKSDLDQLSDIDEHDANYEAASEFSVESEKETGVNNDISEREYRKNKPIEYGCMRHETRNSRIRRFLFSDNEATGQTREGVVKGRVFDVTEYNPPELSDMEKWRKENEQRVLKAAAEAESSPVAIELKNSSPYSVKMDRPRRKISLLTGRRRVMSKYAKYFSLNKETNPPRKWPRRLVVKGNIDFCFKTYKKDFDAEFIKNKARNSNDVTYEEYGSDKENNFNNNLLTRSTSRNEKAFAIESKQPDEDLEILHRSSGGIGLLEKLLGNPTEILKSHSNPISTNHLANRNFWYPALRTGKQDIHDGQPRMPNFHNGDAMYDRPNGGPYASYTTNGARGMRSTYPPTGRGGFGKGNLSKQFRPMTFGTAPRSDYSHTTHPDNSPMKPKVVTVVRAGQIRPHKKITILLNRRSVQTFEQLVADISEALGQPKWKNDHIRKLYTLKGREVKSVSDFFREDDVFIAVGKEQLTTMDVQEVLEELYPDSPYAQNLIRQNLEKAYKNKGARRQPFTIAEGTKGSKSDSGLGDSTEGDRRFNDVGTNKSPRDKARGRHLLNERRKFQEEDRQRAKKWERERMEREQEELEEELRRRGRGRGRVGGASNGIAPASDVEVKTSIRDAERRRKERQQWEAEERERQHRKQREEDEKRRRQLDDNKREREKLQREKEEEERRRLNAEEDARRKREEAEQEKRRRKAEDEERERRRREADKLRKEEEARIKREEEERRIREEDAEREREKRRKEEEARRRREEEEEERRKREEERRNRDRERERERERKREREEREREEELRRREEENSTRSTPQRKQPFHKVDDTDRSRKVQKYKAPSRGMITRSDIETRYEIGKTIGDGNFAIVKESRLRNTEAEYAMKIIDKSKLKGKEDMIENEIAIMKNCIHPNIVRLVEEFETEDEIYLMLEYVKGGDLFDAITESVKFTERDAANMVADLCEALAFLHDKNIVHRDLKPENLLVSRNKDGSMTLKLADFGLAMEVTEPIYTVCGTPTYVAPEILAETGYGLEVDMWATGVITYILLCGFPPFRSHDRNQEELFEIIQLGEYEFLSPYWDSISDAAKDLIFKLLVVDTKRRYTAEQVLQHPWIKSEGSCKKINLQREITMNLERNFGADRSRRKAGLAGAT